MSPLTIHRHPPSTWEYLVWTTQVLFQWWDFYTVGFTLKAVGLPSLSSTCDLTTLRSSHRPDLTGDFGRRLECVTWENPTPLKDKGIFFFKANLATLYFPKKWSYWRKVFLLLSDNFSKKRTFLAQKQNHLFPVCKRESTETSSTRKQVRTKQTNKNTSISSETVGKMAWKETEILR